MEKERINPLFFREEINFAIDKTHEPSKMKRNYEEQICEQLLLCLFLPLWLLL